MWFGNATFIVALLGIIILFVCKAWEKRGNAVPLLVQIRRADGFVSEQVRKTCEELPDQCTHACISGYLHCKIGLHRAGLAAHKRLHRFSNKFGNYLKKQNISVDKNRAASAYLKNVLEYKKESIQKSEQKEIV